jgi:predicted acyl esterase
VRSRLEKLLTQGEALPWKFALDEIRRETVQVTMRDGVRLATDLYLPPKLPAPAIAMRTPYGRAAPKYVEVFLKFVRCGYAVIAQDCRGTGESEPEHWDYYLYESEDSYDLVDWVVRQSWFGGFLAGCGGSYAGQTQWCMATHRGMSAIAPEVSGLGIARNTGRLYMFLNAYARSIGKGEDKLSVPLADLERSMHQETLAGGYFNERLHAPNASLWEHYCGLTCAQRVAFVRHALNTDRVSIVEVEALPRIFGQDISHDAHTLPHARPEEACRDIHAPSLFITGWYDWGLNDALATWEALQREAIPSVRERSRLLITPATHNQAGYHENAGAHPELQQAYRTEHIVSLLLAWYEAVRTDTLAEWPRVTYYLMGANQWHFAQQWPPEHVQIQAFYLGEGGTLTRDPPVTKYSPDRYLYDPQNPTPTVGGSILSYVYPPGSVDVSSVQSRPDVLTYTTPPLAQDLDVAGPLRAIVYVSSSAVDTDFVARLSDVFPDGRAIQIQSGLLRARHRQPGGDPALLQPGQIYRLEIDMWATANRFRAGHCLRLDISSADFPRFDRNSNRGGEAGAPVVATQSVHHGLEHPSHMLIPVLYSNQNSISAPGQIHRAR